MALKRFLIVPYQSGLVRREKPWLIPEDAFTRLQNAFVFRGRVKKRFGSSPMFENAPVEDQQLHSRLRIQIATTDGDGDFSNTTPGIFTADERIGHMFSVGTEKYTSIETGTPAVLLTTGSGTGTYDTTTGTVTILGAPALTPVFFYPSLPVMGFSNPDFLDEVNNHPTFAWDTQFAYEFDTATNAWARLGTATWTGSNSDFFWTANWRGINVFDNILFVTNNVEDDQIKYWDGATWTDFTPLYTSSLRVVTCSFLLAFRDRLCLFNTLEETSTGPPIAANRFINRVRFSKNGSPIDANSFRQDNPGTDTNGSYLDAPTKEAIVSAEYLRDRLIVYFEQSTYELVYTGNEIFPFRWQQINTELGAESTFSIIPFDKAVLGVGNVGIHACSGTNVDRIDDKIPDEVFKIHNGNNGLKRVHGIRDFFTELAYWTFPRADFDPIFPDQMLVFNYTNGAWGSFDDSITAFGYFQTNTDRGWDSLTVDWNDTGSPWNAAAFQSRDRQVVAGNQEGFTFLFNYDEEFSFNAPSLQITNITFSNSTATLTIINHNLNTSDYILIDFAQGITGLNGNIYRVQSVIDANTITVVQEGLSGTYEGCGVASRVAVIDIITREYNFFTQVGRNIRVERINFLVNQQSGPSINDDPDTPQLTADFFVSSADFLSMIENSQATNAIMGNNILPLSPLNDLEIQQNMFWHTVYFQGEGDFFQLRLYWTEDQVLRPAISLSNFTLHAMVIYADTTNVFG